MRNQSFSRWRFVHGPGTDDPIVGVYTQDGTVFERHYFLTDGQGRSTRLPQVQDTMLLFRLRRNVGSDRTAT
jgi:hypothetical protein